MEQVLSPQKTISKIRRCQFWGFTEIRTRILRHNYSKPGRISSSNMAKSTKWLPIQTQATPSSTVPRHPIDLLTRRTLLFVRWPGSTPICSINPTRRRRQRSRRQLHRRSKLGAAILRWRFDDLTPSPPLCKQERGNRLATILGFALYLNLV